MLLFFMSMDKIALFFHLPIWHVSQYIWYSYCMLCSVAASVGGIEMTGISHGPDPTILVTSKVGGPVEATPLVEFKLEVNPLERPEMDMTVKVALKPIQITYDFVSGSGVNQLVLRAARMDVCVSCCVHHCL